MDSFEVEKESSVKTLTSNLLSIEKKKTSIGKK